MVNKSTSVSHPSLETCKLDIITTSFEFNVTAHGLLLVGDVVVSERVEQGLHILRLGSQGATNIPSGSILLTSCGFLHIYNSN